MDKDNDMPLPNGHKPDKPEEKNPAADLVRQKVEAAYASEPSAASETKQIALISENTKLSKHQKFITELTGSGKSPEEVQTAWHEYYIALPDSEKHHVWQEFKDAQASLSRHPAAAVKKTAHAAKKVHKEHLKPISKNFAELAEKVINAKSKKRPPKSKSPVHSLLFGLAAGAIAVMIVLFGFFNERFIAPLIQPSRSLGNVPLISSSAVGPDPEIIIPKINVEIPVVYGVTTINEDEVDKALEKGVVHYADTAVPGENGNVVIVGHSSNNIFNKGKYKFAFVLLSRMELGDTFYLQKDGKRYTYQIYQKKIVKPTDVSVLGNTDKKATATLITCDPPGTTINRLVVIGEQISPSPSGNKAGSTDNSLATKARLVPGNSQTLWARMWDALSR